MQNFTNDLLLCAVVNSDDIPKDILEDVVAKAIRGGATMISLNAKNTQTKEFHNKRNTVKIICDRFGVGLIINELSDYHMINVTQDNVSKLKDITSDGFTVNINIADSDNIEAFVRNIRAMINEYIIKTPVYSKENLKKDLELSGLKPTDCVMIHSSMKAIGRVDGGADAVVDVLMDYFKDGLLMMPTHTWKQMNEMYNTFIPETEDSCVGVITNIFRKKDGVVRSLHPTHSVAVYGSNIEMGIDAKEYVKGDDNYNTPCNPDGCFGKIRKVKGKILLIGVTHARNTYIHSIEESFDVPKRFSDKPVKFRVKTDDPTDKEQGAYKEIQMYRHFNVNAPHISEHFDKMMQGYFVTGAAKRVKFGDADCILCDADKLYEVTKHILDRQINAFLELEVIPKDWYEGLQVT